MAKRLASLALAGALVFAAAPQALAADTIGGAGPAPGAVSPGQGEGNCIPWAFGPAGGGGGGKKQGG